ncbi:hypothetical protein AMK26_27915 [Streptomyces sp. CB03234]|uniref:hypothetical protein n=1 Tax=Streptomyces sp. (strain CB03234) TaxID=1703937 RepID=UPI00093A1295|nr:hypothetical protein [Streptomyces sp. CB03234]OKJ99811.1 hypothetical protein AMK26_27915 [Streptomyces sp. CB03234]
MSIIHAFVRLVLGTFAPGSGRRRAGCRPAPTVPARVVRLPAHRSPYGQAHVLDGEDSVLVRPYLLDLDTHPHGVGAAS